MIGKELAALEELERAHAQPRRATTGDEPVLVRAVGLGRTGAIAPFDLDDPRGRGRRPRRPARLGPHRARPAAVRRRPRRPRRRCTSTARAGALRTPRQALTQRHRLLPEDRRAEGIVGDLTVRENIVLALQADRGWFRPHLAQAPGRARRRYIEALDIRPANPDALMRKLSGGNQQKVLLARWLATAPRLLILDEPTRGIDIGAKAEIQKLVVDLPTNGMACCSSPPSSRRWCGSATASSCCATAARSPSSSATT